ncbi:MAG: site-specific recombinase, partial [Thermoplasmata archaeon]|nr:site-specific recombinase [Thermoplasmata archaeon]
MKALAVPAELRVLEAVPAKKSTAPQRVAIYARISTAKQNTIEEQVAQARQRCQERGWSVRYILKDEALSGRDASRPAFQRLLDLAESGSIDVVVIWKIDRLARSLAHAAAVEEILREHNVAIHSCTEPIDTTTAVGRFVFGNLANAAQLELDLIKDRIRMGMYRCAREGRWTRPSVPLGYRKTKNHHLRIHKEEADLVRSIFTTYLQA